MGRLSKRDREGRSTHPDGGVDNYAYEMEAPKSPWRYPHLMFRADSRKQKSVSFRNGHGRNQLELPGISGFGEVTRWRLWSATGRTPSPMLSGETLVGRQPGQSRC